MTTTETVEGVVEGKNDSGIRINGTWLNKSRFKPVELPDVGTLVRLGVDAKGFITTLEVLDATDTARRNPHVGTRDRTISRLAVLKVAAMFGASRSDLKSSDVLKIADTWLAWIEAES